MQSLSNYNNLCNDKDIHNKLEYVDINAIRHSKHRFVDGLQKIDVILS